MADTNVQALKRLWAAIKGDGAKAEDLNVSTTAEAINAITAAYKGEDPEPSELGTLTLKSTAGTSAGMTKIEASGGSGGSLVYKLNTNTLPAYGDDLTAWTAWNGTDEIAADDGSYMAVCEIDSNNKAVAGGVTMVYANLG